MKLATRLLGAPVVAAAVALAVGGLYAGLMHQQLAGERAAYDHESASFRTIAQVQQQMGGVHAGLYRTIAILNSMDEAEVKRFEQDMLQQVGGAQRALAGVVDAAAADDPLAASVATASPLFARYGTQVAKAVELTSVEVNMGVAAMKAAEATHVELSKALNQVVQAIDAQHTLTVEQAARKEQQLAMALALLALLATGAAVGWAWVAQRRLVREIARAVDISEKVAAGNLTVHVESQRADEIGDLLRSFGRMVLQLRDSMQTVRLSADSIATASVQIASGNTDLSQRTETTASSLQETASAMEQLTGTVRQSADSAAQANQLAHSAARWRSAAARWSRRWSRRWTRSTPAAARSPTSSAPSTASPSRPTSWR
jgi:HAMP domain-containing protein